MGPPRMMLPGYRSPLNVANNVDYEAMKRCAFQDQGVLVISIEDPRLTWAERELVRQLGERLYGKRKAAGS